MGSALAFRLHHTLCTQKVHYLVYAGPFDINELLQFSPAKKVKLSEATWVF
jgi:hypothetical protein